MPVMTKKSGMPGMLTNLLAKRLADDLDLSCLPLVTVNRSFAGRSVQVVVIWDAWSRLSGEQRSQVILDAYAVANPKSPVPTITMGFTSSQALSLGYLPFKIIAIVRDGDRVSRGELDAAMKAAGGVQVRVGDELEIRFATQGQAANAYRFVQTRVPSPVWTLVEERAAAESV